MGDVAKTKDDPKMFNDGDDGTLVYTLNNILERLTKLEAK